MRGAQNDRLDIDEHDCVYKYVVMAETVRINAASHAALADIAKAKRIPLTEALSQAIEAYRREVFLGGVASDFAALRSDTDAWAEEQAERSAWEATNADGLGKE